MLKLPIGKLRHIANNLKVLDAKVCERKGSFFCVLLIERREKRFEVNASILGPLEQYVCLIDMNIWTEVGFYWLGRKGSKFTQLTSFDKEGVIVTSKDRPTQHITFMDLEDVYLSSLTHMNWTSEVVRKYKSYINNLVKHYEVRSCLWQLVEVDSSLGDEYRVEAQLESMWKEVNTKIKDLESAYPIRPSEREWSSVPTPFIST